MRMTLAPMRVVPAAEKDARLPLPVVIAVLQDSIDVALEGVRTPGAFSAAFMERHVIPYLRELEASRA